MFHVFDNLLIFGIFVFAVVMLIRTLCANSPEESGLKNEVKEPLDSPSMKDKDSEV